MNKTDILCGVSVVGAVGSSIISYKTGQGKIKSKIPMYITTGATCLTILLNQRFNNKEKTQLIAATTLLASTLNSTNKLIMEKSPELYKEILTSEEIDFTSYDSLATDLLMCYPNTSTQLFYDSKFDIWFTASPLAVLTAHYNLNRNLSFSEYECRVSEFYSFLHLDLDKEKMNELYRYGWTYEEDSWVDFIYNLTQDPSGEFFEIVYQQKPVELDLEQLFM